MNTVVLYIKRIDDESGIFKNDRYALQICRQIQFSNHLFCNNIILSKTMMIQLNKPKIP